MSKVSQIFNCTQDEAIEYLERNDVQGLILDLASVVLVRRPQNLIEFMIEELNKRKVTPKSST